MRSILLKRTYLIHFRVGMLFTRLLLLQSFFCLFFSVAANANINVDHAFYLPPDIRNTAFKGDLPKIKSRKVIRALVTLSEANCFIRDGKLYGIQVEFLRELEKDINAQNHPNIPPISVKYIPVTFDELIPALKSGKGDIAATFLTETPTRLDDVKITTSTNLVANEILVTHNNIMPPQSIEELSGRDIYLQKNSSYIEHVKQINLQLLANGHKPINILEADPYLSPEDILEMVNSGAISMTVTDNYIGKFWQKVLPNIVLHNNIVIYKNAHLGWAVRKEDTQLHQYLNDFISRKVKKGSVLGNYLLSRYYKNTHWIREHAQINARDKFATLAPIFKNYAEQYSFDYLALATQHYQKSKLDSSMVSHRGSTGIKQLLPDSTKNMGAKNINDANQHIDEGTKQLQWIREHYIKEDNITAEDQLAFSWVAYNAGIANLTQMQALAKKMHLNPHIWFDNVELAAEKILGPGTVLSVSNIYKYYVTYQHALRIRNQRL